MKTIGTIIKEKRKVMKMNQGDVAGALGVSQRTLSYWEQDDRYPNALHVIGLAELFNCSCDELLGRIQNGERSNEEKVSEKDKLLLINENKSNNFDVKSNEELFKQALVEGLNRRFDREIEEAKKIEQIEEMAKTLKDYTKGKHIMASSVILEDYAEALYNAGYRKYPCSIGDTVYCIWQYSDFAKIEPPCVLEDEVIGFVIDEGIIKPITRHYHQYSDLWHTLRDIKFTQEEAEKALAKMKGGEE